MTSSKHYRDAEIAPGKTWTPLSSPSNPVRTMHESKSSKRLRPRNQKVQRDTRNVDVDLDELHDCVGEPTSAFREHFFQPAMCHILILAPLWALNPQHSNPSFFSESRLFPCSVLIGPLITAAASFMHFLCTTSMKGGTGRPQTDARTRHQLSTTLSRALMGFGYIYAFAAVAQSSFFSAHWALSAIAYTLLPVLMFYWMVGITGTYIFEGQRFDDICGGTD